MESQNDLILAELLAHRGDFVAMPDLVRASGSYNIHSRIADLRRQGHDIENKQLRKGRRTLSWYRIPDQEQAQLF